MQSPTDPADRTGHRRRGPSTPPTGTGFQAYDDSPHAVECELVEDGGAFVAHRPTDADRPRRVAFVDGIARLEMPSGIGRDAAVEAAERAAGWLPVFASALHRDARAPVNLTPIAGLERHLHRLQWDARLALRAVREAVLERNREGRTA